MTAARVVELMVAGAADAAVAEAGTMALIVQALGGRERKAALVAEIVDALMHFGGEAHRALVIQRIASSRRPASGCRSAWCTWRATPGPPGPR